MQRVRNTIIGVMLVAVLIQTFATALSVVQFQLNRNYYAEVLCENKNRPELACKGQCVLMKRLQNEYDQQQDQERRTIQNLLDRELTLFCNDFIFSLIQQSPKTIFTKTLNFSTQNYITQYAFSDIFHPPAFRV